MKIFKLLLFVFIFIISFSSCSKDDETYSWKGFEAYEGTWAPIAYELKGEWHGCDPNYPGISNIDRLTFIKYEGNGVILRDECYSSNTGEWSHRRDQLLWWKDGSFYEDAECSPSKKCTDLYISSEGYLHLCSSHSYYFNGLRLKKIK